MKATNRLNILAQLISLPFMVIMVVILVNSISDYDSKKTSLDKKTLEATVEKYVIQCYASEGAYPPDLEYLSSHYGLILDNERYEYDYEVFASNIMPEIIITEIVPNTDSNITENLISE